MDSLNIISMNLMVLNVGYAETQHHWGERDLSSPFVRLYYAVKGRAMLHLPQGDVEVRPGYMYLVPTYVPHSYECDPGFGFYYLFVYEKYRDKTDVFDRYEFPVEVKANEATVLLFNNYCSLYPQLSLPYRSAQSFDEHQSYKAYAESWSNMAHYERLQLQGLVWILFSYFMKHSTEKASVKDDRVMLVAEYIQHNLSRDIKLKELADMAYVTPPHLTRLFKTAFGMPPLRYIIQKKVQYAQGLLLTTDMTVRDIAREIGIDDVSYFIRIFKKTIGFTPQDYRNKLR